MLLGCCTCLLFILAIVIIIIVIIALIILFIIDLIIELLLIKILIIIEIFIIFVVIFLSQSDFSSSWLSCCLCLLLGRLWLLLRRLRLLLW